MAYRNLELALKDFLDICICWSWISLGDSRMDKLISWKLVSNTDVFMQIIITMSDVTVLIDYGLPGTILWLSLQILD